MSKPPHGGTAQKPIKVESSPSERLDRLYLERDAGGLRIIAGGELFVPRQIYMKLWNKNYLRVSIIVVFATVIVATTGYFGLSWYVDQKEDRLGRESREGQLEALLEEQRSLLEETRSDIEQLQREGAISKQESLQRIEAVERNSGESDFAIQASEIFPYLSGVGEVECYGNFGNPDKSGSASLWKMGSHYLVMTNYHVIVASGDCTLTIEDEQGGLARGGFYKLNKAPVYYQDPDVDVALLEIEPFELELFAPVKDLNYDISQLRFCSSRVPLGSSIVVIGFPAFSQTETIIGNTKIDHSVRTITNGVVSAIDQSASGIFGQLVYDNYFVSAKIDSGNSGGIAFSKDEGGLCVLGIPTWLQSGVYETQGIVQNIHNVLYTEE